jgi:hypothetical protein
MSSTSNVQNLFTNVFRPVYVYDTTSNAFRPKLEMSNVDTYIGNEVSVYRVQVGDSNSNVYVGSNSGNAYSNLQGCTNNTVLGYAAGFGMSNVSNSVFLGYNVGVNVQNTNSVIAIGASAAGTGTANIYLGSSAGNAGSNNIAIGNGALAGVPTYNQLRIGNPTNYLLSGDMASNWIGVGLTTQQVAGVTNLDVSGGIFTSGKLGVQMTPSNSLNVNGATQSTLGLFSVTGTTPLAGNASYPIANLLDGLVLFTSRISDNTGIYINGMYAVLNAAGSIFSPITQVSGGASTYAITGSVGTILLTNLTSSPITVAWTVMYIPLTP